MDYDSMLPHQTMYFQGQGTNTYSFGFSYSCVNYHFPYYQTSPSFAYYLSNSMGLT